MNTQTQTRKLHTLHQIKYAASTGNSPHWFDAGALRFFNSRLSNKSILCLVEPTL